MAGMLSAILKDVWAWEDNTGEGGGGERRVLRAPPASSSLTQAPSNQGSPRGRPALP